MHVRRPVYRLSLLGMITIAVVLVIVSLAASALVARGTAGPRAPLRVPAEPADPADITPDRDPTTLPIPAQPLLWEVAGVEGVTSMLRAAEIAVCAVNRGQAEQAIARYYVDSSAFPVSLAQLYPTYINRVPSCPAAGTAYRMAGDTVACPLHGNRAMKDGGGMKNGDR
jgi:hypothetical protein